jgi:hypothetical protein
MMEPVCEGIEKWCRAICPSELELSWTAASRRQRVKSSRKKVRPDKAMSLSGAKGDGVSYVMGGTPLLAAAWE